MSRVDDLNDACFALSAELVGNLSDTFEEEIGEAPTLDELCELLRWGLQANRGRFSDEKPIAEVTGLKAKARRSKMRLTSGDVVAVPVAGSRWNHLLVFLGRYGHFGDAFGVLRGLHPLAPFDGEPSEYDGTSHVFLSIEPIERGRWTVVGHREDLRLLFPDEPEYFHLKSDHPDHEGIGPHGSAETPYRADGTGSVLRDVSEEEAIAFGLDLPSFRMSPTENQLIAWLAERFDAE